MNIQAAGRLLPGKFRYYPILSDVIRELCVNAYNKSLDRSPLQLLIKSPIPILYLKLHPQLPSKVFTPGNVRSYSLHMVQPSLIRNGSSTVF